MKKIATILLLIFSTNVWPEWISIKENDTYTYYIDIESISRNGGKGKIWDLTDYKSVQKTNNDKYLSLRSHTEYDCEEKTSIVLDYSSHSKHMGHGEVVHSQSNLKDEPFSIPPESLAEWVLKIACGKK